MAATEPRDNDRPRKVLYCHPRLSTFIQRDITGLGTRYEVAAHEFAAAPAWMLPFRLLHQLAWLLIHRTWSRDCICHFSGYHALLPTLLCKRTFIVLAGSDCASIPAINYGDHSRRLMGWASRTAAARATRLLPVHESLMHRTGNYAEIVPEAQGIRAFAKVEHVPWTTVPYGFDADFWCPDPTIARDPCGFVCVPGPAAPGNRVHQLKGVDLVLRIAERLPDARFRIVGLADPSAYPAVAPNVELIGRVNAAELRNIYRSSSFHLQLSLSEGMPNALCEAMLCGCIPLVSAVSSMPDIVRGCGLVLEHRDADLGVRACTELLTMDHEQRITRASAARDRIRTDHPMERRLNALFHLLDSQQ